MENLKRQIEAKIAQKLATNPGFRKTLFDNPGRAISEELGIAIPAGVKAAVREEGARGVSLILTEGSELKDELLERVAAGGTGQDPWS